MLATAGGVVFSGGTSDRRFHAFDASSGKLLWDFPTNSGILAPPTSFAVDGKQYIAVLSGWGGDSRGMQASSIGFSRANFRRCRRAARYGSSRWSNLRTCELVLR